MKNLRTGSMVRYISDAYPEYSNQECIAVDFELEHRIMSLECSDGQIIAAFWNEVEVLDAT